MNNYKYIQKIISILMIMVIMVSASSPLVVIEAFEQNDDPLNILDQDDLVINDEGNYEATFSSYASSSIEYTYSNTDDFTTYIDSENTVFNESGYFYGNGESQSIIISPKEGATELPDINFYIDIEDISYDLSEVSQNDEGLYVHINYEESEDYSDVEFKFTYDSNVLILDSDKESFTVKDLEEDVHFSYVDTPKNTTIYLNAIYTYKETYTNVISEDVELSVDVEAETSDSELLQDGDIIDQPQDITASSVVTPTDIETTANSETVELCYKGSVFTTSTLTNQEHCLTNPVEVQNSGFEDITSSVFDNSSYYGGGVSEDYVPFWNTTDAEDTIEVWRDERVISGTTYNSSSGELFIELNYKNNASIYQDFLVTGGETINYSIAHAKRKGDGTDNIKVVVGYPKENPSSNDTEPVTSTVYSDNFSSSTTVGEWVEHTGEIDVPVADDGNPYYLRIAVSSDGTASGDDSVGNLLDDVVFVTQGTYDMESAVEQSTNPAYVNNDVIGDVYAETKHIKGDTMGAPTFSAKFSDVNGDAIQLNPIIGSASITAFYYDENGDKVDSAVFEGEDVNFNINYDFATISIDEEKLEGVYYTDFRMQFTNQFPTAYDEYKVQFQVDYKYKTDEAINSTDAEQYYIVAESEDAVSRFCTEVDSNVSADETYQPHCLSSDINLVNPSFEDPDISSTESGSGYVSISDSEVPGWTTTDDNMILRYLDGPNTGPEVSVDGTHQALEVSASKIASTYQDFSVIGGETIYYEFSHVGKSGTDVMDFFVAYPYDEYTDLTEPYSVALVDEQYTTTSGDFVTYDGYFTAPIRADGNGYDLRLGFAQTNDNSANFVDDVKLLTDVVLDEETKITDKDTTVTDINKKEYTYSTEINHIKGDKTAPNSIMEVTMPTGTVYDSNDVVVTEIDEDGNEVTSSTLGYSITNTSEGFDLLFDSEFSGLKVEIDFSLDANELDDSGSLDATSKLTFQSSPELENFGDNADTYWLKDSTSINYESDTDVNFASSYDDYSGNDTNAAGEGETIDVSSYFGINGTNSISNPVVTIDLDDEFLDMSTFQVVELDSINGGEAVLDESSISISGNTVNVGIIGEMAPGDAYNLKYTIQVIDDFDSLSYEVDYDNDKIVGSASMVFDEQDIDEHGVYESDFDFSLEKVYGDVSLTKEAIYNGSEVSTGDTITYTITAENVGSSDIDNVIINDPVVDQNLGAQSQATSVSPSGTDLGETDYTISTDGKTINIEDIKVGGKYEIVLAYDVADLIIPTSVISGTGLFSLDSQFIYNEATLNSEDIEKEVKASALVPLNIDTNLVASKTATPSINGAGGVVAGEQIDYKVTILNDGDITETNINVVDDFALESDLDASTYSLKSISIDGNALTENDDYLINDEGNITINSLDPEAVLVIEYSVNANDIFDSTPTIDNTVNVTSDYSTVLPIEVNTPKDLSGEFKITKTADKTDVQAGEQINYTVEIENTGSVISEKLNFEDVIDSDMVDVGSFTGYNVTSSERTMVEGSDYNVTDKDIEFLNVIPNEIITINYGYNTVTDFSTNGDNITNTVSISDSVLNIDLEDSVDVKGYDFSDISFDKTVTETNGDGDGLADYGEELTYTITVENNSGTDLTNAKVKDELPTTISNNAVSHLVELDGNILSDSEYTYSSATNNISDLSIPNGSTLEYTLVVNVETLFGADELANGTTISNTATFNADQLDASIETTENIEFDIAEALSVVLNKSLLSTEDGDMLADPGETITYEIVVQNNGGLEIPQLDIVEDLSDSNLENTFTNVEVDMAGTPLVEGTDYTEDGSSIQLYDFKPGSIYTITLDVETIASFSNTDYVNNSIEAFINGVSKAQEDVDVAIDKQLTNVTMIHSASLTTDSDGDGLVDPNDQVTYEVEITNNSNVPLSNVVLNTAPTSNNLTNVSIISVLDSLGNNVANSGSLTALNIDSIPVGETITVTFTADGSSSFTEKDTSYILNSTLEVEDLSDDLIAYDATVYFDYEDNSQVSVRKDAENLTNPTNPSQPGDELQYTVTVENTGATSLFDLSLSDDVSDVNITNGSIVLDSASSTESSFNGVTLSGNEFTFDELVPGEIVTIIYTVSTEPNYEPGDGNIYNTINVIDSSAYIDASFTEQYPIDLSLTDLSVTKTSNYDYDTDGDNKADPGEKVAYDVKVVNEGNVTANNVTISDDTDMDNVTFDSVIVKDENGNEISSSDYTIVGTDLTLDYITAGEFITVTFIYQTNNTYNSDYSIDNTVTISNDNISDITASASYDIDTDNNASMAIEKEVSDASGDDLASTSEELTYTITVTNDGSVGLNNVHVIDELNDRNLSGVAVIDSLQINGTDYTTYTTSTDNPLDIVIPVLEADDILEIVIKVDTNATFSSGLFSFFSFASEMTIDNTVSVSSDEISKEEAEASITVDESISSVDVTKTVSDASGNNLAEAGEELTYTVTVENDGTLDQDNLKITDNLIDENIGALTFLEFKVDSTLLIKDTDYSINGNTATVNSLKAGETLVVTYTTNVNDDIIVADSIDNTVNVTSDYNINEDALATIDLNLDEIRELNITKVADAGSDNLASPNEAIKYTVTITNDGSSIENNILIDEDLSDENLFSLVLTSFTPKLNGDPTDIVTYLGSNQFNISTLNPDDVLVLEFNVTVKSTITNADNVTNIVNYTSEDGDLTGQASVDVPLDVESNSEITASKEMTVAGSSVDANEIITNEISIENTGSVVQDNIIVSDPITDPSLTGTISNLVVENQDGTVLVIGTDYDYNETTQEVTIYELSPDDTYTITFETTAQDEVGPNVVYNEAQITSDIVTTPIIVMDELPTSRDYMNILVDKNVSDASGDGIVQTEEVITYDIKIENNGSVYITDFMISDIMDLSQIDLSASETNISITNQDGVDISALVSNPSAYDFVFNNYELKNGDSINIQLTFKANSNFSGNPLPTTIDNEVYLTDGLSGGSLDENAIASDSESIALDVDASLAVQMSVNDSLGDNDNLADSTEQLSYELVLTNTGNASLNNIDFTMNRDDLNLDYDSATVVNIIDANDGSTLVNGVDYRIVGDVLTVFSLSADQQIVVNINVKTNNSLKNSDDIIYNLDYSQELISDDNVSASIGIDYVDLADYTVKKIGLDEDLNNYAANLEEITYEIEVENTGKVDFEDITISDTISANGTYDNISNIQVSIDSNPMSYVPTVSTNNIEFTGVDLAVGEKLVIKYTANAVSDFQSQDPISNTVTVDVNNGIAPKTAEEEILSDIASGTDYELEYFINETTLDDNLASPGENLTYSTVIKNTSETQSLQDINLEYDLSDINIDDNIPTHSEIQILSITDNTLLTSYDATSWFSYNSTDNTYVLNIPTSETFSVPAGYYMTFDIYLDNNSTFEDSDIIKSDVTSNINMEGTSINVEDDIDISSKDYSVSIDKSVVDTDTKNGATGTADGFADTSEELVYTVEVKNDGLIELTDLEIYDPFIDSRLDASTISVEMDGNPITPTDNKIIIPSLLSGAQSIITYTVDTTSEFENITTDIYNTVYASNDDVSEQDTTTIPIPSAQDGDITVTKSADVDGGSLNTSETITYTVSVENNTSYQYDDFMVMDDLDTDNVDYVLGSAEVYQDGTLLVAGSNYENANNPDNPGELIIYTLYPNSNLTITYDVLANDSFNYDTEVINTAGVTVENTEGDTNTYDDENSVDIDVDGESDIEINKTATPDEGSTLSSGEDVSYTVTVENTGGVGLNNVVVTDLLNDVNLEQYNATPTATPSVGTWNSATNEYTIATLDAGASVDITFDTKVKDSILLDDVDLDDPIITNTASVVTDTTSNSEVTIATPLDISGEPKISASDLVVKVSDAPKDDASIIELMNAKAFDYDATSITDIDVDPGTYDYDNPALGTYTITFTTTSSEGLVVSTTATLTVINDTESAINAEVVGNSPVNVELGDGTSSSDLTNIIDPHLKQYYDGVLVGTDSNVILVDDGGYDNGIEGTYIFTYEGTFSFNGQSITVSNSFEVIVSPNVTTESQVTIDALEHVIVATGSLYDPIVTQQASATSITDGLIELDVISNTVNTANPNTYLVSYYAEDSTGAYANKTVMVTVQDTNVGDDATITASDYMSSTMVSEEDLIDLMNVEALDYDGEDLISDVVVDYGNYDSSNIVTEGTYDITFSVKGESGVVVSTEVQLIITAGDIYEAEIIGNDPIEVEVGSTVTESQITNMIDPQLIGSTNSIVDLVDSSPTLISSGGYNTSTKATYVFTYEATYQNIVVQESFIVNVVNNLDVNSSVVTIEADDPVSVIVNSDFDEIETPNASASSTHGDKSAELVVYYSDMDITTVKDGYTIVYKAYDTEGNEAYKTITVNVKDDVDGENAQLLANDSMVKQSSAPTNDTELLALLDAKALDLDSSDITSDIIVKDLGGYNYSTKDLGSFEITLEIKGSNDVIVQKVVTLSVVADDTDIYDVEIIGNDPVTISKGDLTDPTTIINPQALQKDNGSIVNVSTDVILVDTGGYDANTEGTYYLVYETEYQALTIQEVFEVNVVDSATTSSEVIIAADDPTVVLENSLFNPYVTTNVEATSTGGTNTTISVEYMDVDTSVVKDGYVVTYKAEDEDGAVAYLTINVNVIANNPGENAIIFADDYVVYQSNAPTTEVNVISDMNATALENDGIDISSSIEITDFDGYDISSPQIGNYEITFSVKGSNGVIVDTMAELTVKVDGSVPIYETDIIGTTPVSIQVDSTQNVEDIINAKYVGSKNGVIQTISDDVTLISDSGYDVSQVGTYYFVYEGTYEGITSREVFEVRVVNEEVNSGIVTITADDPTKVLVDSDFDPEVTPNPSASSTDGTATLSVFNSTVDITTTGSYEVTYYAVDENNNEAYKTIVVEVVEPQPGEDAILTANDSNVKLSDAPSDDSEIISVLNTQAFEPDGTNLYNDVEIFDYDGYNALSPTIGSYEITLQVKGSSGVIIQTTVSLNIVADTTNPFYEAEIIGTSKVYVKTGDDVNVTTLINPMLSGSINGQVEYVSNDDVILSNDNGYDYYVEGSYFIEYSGEYNGLEVTNTFEVIVSDDVETKTSIEIQADDPTTIIEGSTFDEILTPNASATSDAGNATLEVIYNDVISGTAGRYNVTYYAYDEDGNEAYKTIEVIVLADDTTYPQIFASDYTVNYSNRPTIDELVDVHNVKVYEEDGVLSDTEVQIISVDGYDYDNVSSGTQDFEIIFSVLGDNGITKETKAKLTIVDDGTSYEQLEIIGNEPIHIQVGDSTNPQTYIEPKALLTDQDDQVISFTDLTSSELISDGDYNSNVEGTYEFVYQTTINSITATNSFTVIVVDDELGSHSFVEIYADDPTTVLVNSVFDEINTPNAYAESRHSTIEYFDFVNSTVDTSTSGVYEVTYYAKDESGAESYKTIVVNVVDETPGEDAILSANDTVVKVSDAPRSDAQIISELSTVAIDVDSTDLTNEVSIAKYGGYNIDSPEIGDYEITLNVTGANDVTVDKTVTLKVVSDTTTPIYKAEIVGNNPIYVENGDGTLEGDLADIINPQILGYEDNVLVSTENNVTLTNSNGYDNLTNGTYYVEYSGEYQNIEVTGVFEVIVASNIETSSSVIIEATDPTIVIIGSTFDEFVTPNASATDINGDAVSDFTTIFNNVNVNAVGNYEITYKATNGDETAYKTIVVSVVDEKPGEDAILTASDAMVELSDAPSTDGDLLTTLNANAYDVDGTDLTSTIRITDTSGYDVNNPAIGTFEITLEVTGSNDVIIQIKAMLVVASDGASPIYSAEIIGNSPVYVANGDTTSLDDLIEPQLLGSEDGNVVEVNKTLELTDSNGYDYDVDGTYYVEYTGTYEGLNVTEVFTVIVSSSETSGSIVKIDAIDPTIVIKDSFYDDVITPEASATSTDSGATTTLDVYDSNVDITTVGKYHVTYEAVDSNGNIAYKTIEVEVVDENPGEDAILSAQDTNVELTDAPTTDADIITTLSTEAIDSDGTDLLNEVVVVDAGGYDVNAPAIGSYEVILQVKGNNKVAVQVTVNLNVVADNTDPLYSAKVVGNNPVYVANGDATPLDDLIEPQVIGYINGTESETGITATLSDNNGYDYDTDGTYYVEYTGTYEGLEVTGVFEVIVSSSEETSSVVTINADDPVNLVVGSLFNEILTPNASATSTEGSATLSVIYNDVYTQIDGKYNVTYYAVDTNGNEAYKTITVNVYEESPGEDAIITANDVNVKLADAPTTDAEIISTLNTQAIDVDATDLLSDVYIVNYDGYDIDSPAVNSYDITLAVKGSNKIIVETTATLNVVNDSTTDLYSAEIIGNSPVYVELNSSASLDNIIEPQLVGKVNGVVDYVGSDATLSDDNGYDSSKEGTYYVEYSGTYQGLEVTNVFEVIVAADIENGGIVTIEANDPTNIIVNSKFDPITTPDASASSTVGDAQLEVYYSNVVPGTIDDYIVTYYAIDSEGNEAYKTIVVNVLGESPIDDALLITNDANVRMEDAPKDEDTLFSIMNVQAIDSDNSIITEQVRIESLGGYEYDNPQTGSFEIIYSVIGDNNVTIQSISTLTVENNDADVHSASIIGNNPVNIVQNSGEDANDVLSLIDPHLLGYENGLLDEVNSNVTITSAGGYNNAIVDTYRFEVEGTYKGITTSKLFIVNVIPDNGEESESAILIEGLDPTNIMVGDEFIPITTSRVTAESTVDGDVSSELEVVENTVDNEVAGSYTTIYKVVDSEGNEAYKFIEVNVVDYDSSTMGTLVSSDTTVSKGSIDSATDSDIVELMNAKATDIDGSDLTQYIQVDGYSTISLFRNVTPIESNIDYSLISNTPGEYVITFSFVDNDNNVITSSSVLTVTEDEYTNYEIHGNDPIVVANGDGTTIDDIIDLISPELIDDEGNIIGKYEVSLVDNGGYDNDTDSNYTFVFEVEVDGQTISESFDVIVDSSVTETTSAVSIEADDPISVQVNSSFDPINDPNMNAQSITDGDITSSVRVTNNVDITQIGSYDVIYEVTDSEGNSAFKAITVIVYGEDVVIDGNDSTVDIDSAPDSIEDLEDILDLVAIDNGNDVSDNLEITNLDGYDYDNPTSGEYRFEICYIGVNGIEVCEIYTLTITQAEITDTGLYVFPTFIIVLLILLLIILKRRKENIVK